jgi:hypothetical protein
MLPPWDVDIRDNYNLVEEVHLTVDQVVEGSSRTKIVQVTPFAHPRNVWFIPRNNQIGPIYGTGLCCLILFERHFHMTWAYAMRKLFQHAIQVHHQRGQMSPAQFDQQVAQIERNCDRLLHQDLAPPEAQNLQRRYLKYRFCLFVFLYRNDVELTNNVAERALRHSVVHRKVTNGFRSHWGTNTYAALAYVIDTAELAGVRAFNAILSLLGPPALPIPLIGE